MAQQESRADFEGDPLTRSEYIAAMVHFYRGEMNRANVWRQRLDHTTNWAVVTSAAIITFSFSEPEHTHLLLVFSQFLILGFLYIEARRFRYYSVFRARVRMLEENFILPIVTRNLVSPKPDWRELVAMDLDVPKFKTTLTESLAKRIRYNYYWIVSALSLAWVLKVWLHPQPAHSWAQLYENMTAGPMAGWLVLSVWFSYALGMTLMFFKGGRMDTTTEDEIHGYEMDRSHWKF